GFPRPGRVLRGVAFGVVFLSVAACISAIPAFASPETDYANATAQAAKIQVQIAWNSRRADILDEQYLIAQRAVTAAKRKITATQQQISVIEARARRLRDRLGSRAALLYIGAGNSDPIGINVSSVQDLGSRAQYADAAAAKDGHLLDDLKRADAQLNSQRDTLEGQLAAAQDQELAAERSHRAVEQINASMQKLLDSTSANVKMLVAQIEQHALVVAAAAERAWLQRLAAEEAARRAH